MMSCNENEVISNKREKAHQEVLHKVTIILTGWKTCCNFKALIYCFLWNKGIQGIQPELATSNSGSFS